MTCETARLLIHPYIDGELDLSRSLELEEHVRGCAACAAEVSAVRSQPILGPCRSHSPLPPCSNKR